MKIKKGSIFLVLVILMAMGLCLPTKALAQVVTVTGETVLQIVQVTVTGETIPKPPPPPEEDVGVGAPTYYTKSNLFGTKAWLRISYSGELQKTVEATSEDGNLTITIPRGTIALGKDGKRLKELEAAVDESPPDPPEDAHIIWLPYVFSPNGATFDPAISLTWSYDPDALPEGVAEEDLVIAYYDEALGEWVELDCVVDTENNTITASVSHFTTFAIIGHVTPPLVVAPPVAPAAFSLSNLAAQPAEIQPKEAVTITVSVANTGGREGSYTVVLKLNGVKEAEKSVTVAAGRSKTVTFSVTKEEAGIYSVTVDGLNAIFTVVAPPTEPEEEEVAPPPTEPEEVEEVPGLDWLFIGGIIAAAIAVVLVAVLIILIRRRAH